ncbi:MAG TPA: zinc dependent phospholipase C family protein [Saprospiraceae bacterium]|nr:zinc dependent phospholipase C family protein [Saprospiraceae bacterium]HMQ84291.1 zinc dependent phospholipase C family protein [Saprospiraceae bacterium]
MKPSYQRKFLMAGLFVGLLFFSSTSPEWGFFGHRRINRMAVFTLPPEMILFYKRNIEYVTEHAVDPDKRRYATKHEAVRHYIDIDHWGTFPFDNIPREWSEALAKFLQVSIINQAGDTLLMDWERIAVPERLTLPGADEAFSIDFKREFLPFFRENILPQYYEEEWKLSCDSLASLFGLSAGVWDCQKVIVQDGFSGYGIVPYHLEAMQNRLTEAFRRQDVGRILQLSAEMGHYIGDAHVPLHTTENYNGQLTDQIGIHAFWESRLPELYADNSYDYFVGKAEYIEKPREYFWNMVLESHQLLDSVLAVEKALSKSFPPDKQYCFEERLGVTIKTQCRDYAEAYHKSMQGMVERRMRSAIHAIGCSWYTAWIDAGQPNLFPINKYELTPEELEALDNLNTQYQSGDAKGRTHEDQ